MKIILEKHKNIILFVISAVLFCLMLLLGVVKMTSSEPAIETSLISFSIVVLTAAITSLVLLSILLSRGYKFTVIKLDFTYDVAYIIFCTVLMSVSFIFQATPVNAYMLGSYYYSSSLLAVLMCYFVPSLLTLAIFRKYLKIKNLILELGVTSIFLLTAAIFVLLVFYSDANLNQYVMLFLSIIFFLCIILVPIIRNTDTKFTNKYLRDIFLKLLACMAFGVIYILFYALMNGISGMAIFPDPQIAIATIFFVAVAINSSFFIYLLNKEISSTGIEYIITWIFLPILFMYVFYTNLSVMSANLNSSYYINTVLQGNFAILIVMFLVLFTLNSYKNRVSKEMDWLLFITKISALLSLPILYGFFNALYFRISFEGFTIPRSLAIVAGIWFIVLTIYLIVRRNISIKFAIITFIVLFSIAMLTPVFNIFNLTMVSQKTKLLNALATEHRFRDGFFVRSDEETTSTFYYKTLSDLETLMSDYGTNIFDDVMTDSQMNLVSEYTHPIDRASVIANEILNIGGISDLSTEESYDTYFIYAVSDYSPQEPYDIRVGIYKTYYATGTGEDILYGDYPNSIFLTFVDNELKFYENQTSKAVVIPVDKAIEAAKSGTMGIQNNDILTYNFLSENYSGTIFIRTFSCFKSSDKIETLTGDLYIRHR